MAARPDAWNGAVYLSLGRALYIGPVRDTRVHAHHAVQVCLSLEKPFRLRAGPDAPWQSFDAAIVAADASHQLDGCDEPHVIAYLEPESVDGRRISAATTDGAIAAVNEEVLARVRSAVLATKPSPELFAEVFRSLDLAPLRDRPLDRRVSRVLDELRADPNRYGAIAELAESVGLSPRRLRHLFRDQLGISCQRYLVWLRLYQAVREMAVGTSITDAAHQVGFADAAYLTRTFRRMFGITPSSIHGSVHLVPEAE